MKAIPITVINYNNNNNQYAELAFFAEEDEDEGYEWDCAQAIIPKPLLLASNRAQVWKQFTTTKNLPDGKHNDLLTDTVKLTKAIHYAVFDSGATGNFIIEGAPVVNKCVDLNPISITLPDGQTITSTHTCNLDIPWLPHNITEAHIVPGLLHSSLISTRKFCDAGCKVEFNETGCKVYYQGKLVMKGDKSDKIGLWHLPVHPSEPPDGENITGVTSKESNSSVKHGAANSVYTLPYKQQQVKYMHQFFLQPTNCYIGKSNCKQPTHWVSMYEKQASTKISGTITSHTY